jgi:TPR repeat protein
VLITRPLPVGRSTQNGAGLLPILVVVVVLAALVAIAGTVWLQSTDDAPRQPPLPAPTPVPASQPKVDISPETPAAQSTQGPEKKASLMSVKDLLAANKPADEIIAAARDYLAQSEPGPAFLLLRSAARGGSAEAAFEIARFYDPVNFGTSPSPFPSPNPTKALDWYDTAKRGGFNGAANAMKATLGAVREQADTGDKDAKALLEQWPQ